MKFRIAQHAALSADRSEGLEGRRLGKDWRDLLGILILSFVILSLGSWAIALASYQILRATEPNVEQVSSPLAWDF